MSCIEIICKCRLMEFSSQPKILGSGVGVWFLAFFCSCGRCWRFPLHHIKLGSGPSSGSCLMSWAVRVEKSHQCRIGAHKPAAVCLWNKLREPCDVWTGQRVHFLHLVNGLCCPCSGNPTLFVFVWRVQLVNWGGAVWSSHEVDQFVHLHWWLE
jgi:hypothetical protein